MFGDPNTYSQGIWKTMVKLNHSSVFRVLSVLCCPPQPTQLDFSSRFRKAARFDTETMSTKSQACAPECIHEVCEQATWEHTAGWSPRKVLNSIRESDPQNGRNIQVKKKNSDTFLLESWLFNDGILVVEWGFLGITYP